MKRRRSSAAGYELNGTQRVYPPADTKVVSTAGGSSRPPEPSDDNDRFGQVLFPDFAPTSIAAS